MLHRFFQLGFFPGFRSHGRVLFLVLVGAIVALMSPACVVRASTPALGLRAQGSAESARGDAPPQVPAPLPKGKKLILTDGTFQIVREYQREGDRVRYYSLERSAWEEIPASLVDWAATQNAESEDVARDKALTQKIKDVARAARTADIDADRSYEVRPGIILPDEAGLYALDDSVVIVMQQNLAVSHANKGRAVERVVTGVPFISTKAKIELPGAQAKIRFHSSDPEFYFRTADGRQPEIALWRAEADKHGTRNLTTMTVDFGGETTYKGDEIPLLSWDAARGLYRLTVERMLDAGEYAIVEKGSEGLSLYVWDFGVDADAVPDHRESAKPSAGTKQ